MCWRLFVVTSSTFSLDHPSVSYLFVPHTPSVVVACAYPCVPHACSGSLWLRQVHPVACPASCVGEDGPAGDHTCHEPQVHAQAAAAGRDGPRYPVRRCVLVPASVACKVSAVKRSTAVLPLLASGCGAVFHPITPFCAGVPYLPLFSLLQWSPCSLPTHLLFVYPPIPPVPHHTHFAGSGKMVC